MNVPIRRLSTVVLVLVLVLVGSTTYYQYVRAGALNSDTRNARTLYQQYGVFRGPIVVGGKSVALSEPVKDPFKYQRKYTDGSLYAAVTGYYSLVFAPTQIEKTEDSILNGTADDLWKQRLKQLMTGAQQQGSSVELTIDAKAQEAAAKALGNQTGAVVAIDPSTGKVLALYSSPSFDPNELAGHDTSKVNDNWKKLIDDKAQPLANRAIQASYPPGSTFKLVVSAAALESGKYTPDTQIPAPTTYRLPGSTSVMSNAGGEVCSSTGKMSLEDALQISCDTAYAKLGVKLGNDALRSQADKFGFDTDLSIPLTVAQSRYPADQDPAQTANSAIGQGSVTATPMQMAMVSAAIANGGVEMQPYLVQSIRSPSLAVVSKTSPKELRRSVSSGTADDLTQMMEKVVQSGTGTTAQIPGVQVAGKTGTAEHGKNPDGSSKPPQAWFTSFAPADNPKVAVAVVVENGGNLGSNGSGTTVAAPIAKAVMEAVLNG